MTPSRAPLHALSLAMIALPLAALSACGGEDVTYCYTFDQDAQLVRTSAAVTWPDGRPYVSEASVDEYVICGGEHMGPITLQGDALLRGHPSEGSTFVIPPSTADGSLAYAIGIVGGSGGGLEDLTLKGQGVGIGLLAVDGADITLTNIRVEGAMEEGVHLEESAARIDGLDIQLTAGGYGLAVVVDSAADAREVTITGASPTALLVQDSAFLGEGISVSGVTSPVGLGVGIYLIGTGATAGEIALGDVAISQVEGYGLVSDGPSVALTGITLDAISRACISVEGAARFALEAGEIGGCGGIGVASRGVGATTLTDLSLERVTRGDGALATGILVEGGDGGLGAATVEGATLSRIEGVGIYVDGANAAVSGSTLTLLEGYGIALLEGSLTATGNDLSAIVPLPDQSTAYGIYAQAPNIGAPAPLVFAGNTIQGVETGMRVDGRDASFEGDAITGGAYGIRLLGGEDADPDWQLTDVVAQGQAELGVEVRSAGTVVVTGLKTSAAPIGFQSADVSDLTLSGGDLRDHATYAASFIRTTGTLAGNAVTGSAIGLSCSSSALTLSENTFSGNDVDVEGCDAP